MFVVFCSVCVLSWSTEEASKLELDKTQKKYEVELKNIRLNRTRERGEITIKKR